MALMWLKRFQDNYGLKQCISAETFEVALKETDPATFDGSAAVMEDVAYSDIDEELGGLAATGLGG